MDFFVLTEIIFKLGENWWVVIDIVNKHSQHDRSAWLRWNICYNQENKLAGGQIAPAIYLLEHEDWIGINTCKGKQLSLYCP